MRLLGMNNSEHETSIDLQSVQNNVGVDLCVHLSVLSLEIYQTRLWLKTIL